MSKVTGKDYSEGDNAIYSRGSLRSPSHGYVTGMVETDHGIAMVWINHGKPYQATRIEIVKGGRRYYRHWRRAWSKQYAVTLACRFADDLFTQDEDGDA